MSVLPPAPARTPTLDVLAVPIEPGVTLVEASAGTGKTFAITGLVLRLVLEERVTSLSRLLVVTFTTAATDELKTRIRTALRAALVAFSGGPRDPRLAEWLDRFVERYGTTQEDRERSIGLLRRALAGADEAAVSTIHGFCKRELERAAFASGTPFATQFSEDDAPLMRRASSDVWHRLAHGNAVLAGLVAARGWHEEGLREVYRMARRHPRTRVVPEAAPLDEALAAFGQAGDRLAAALDGDGAATFMEAVRAVGWKKDAKLNTTAPETVVRRLRHVAAGQTAGNLDAVGWCRPDAIEGAAFLAAKNRPAVDALLAHATVRACEGVTAALVALERSATLHFVGEMGRTLDRLKRRAGVLSFDDLLHLLYNALEDPVRGPGMARAVSARYEAALIDEFQDTDPYQLGIFQRALAGRPVFYIGDPKQAIYAFRGADLFAYLGAREDAAQRFALDTNWRSASGLVAAVNALFAPQQRPFVYSGIPYEPVLASPHADSEPLEDDGRPPFVWWTFSPEDNRGSAKVASKATLRPRVVQAVVREIRRLIGGGVTIGGRPLHAGDVAVLVRTHREGAVLQEALRRAGIQAVVGKGEDVTASREMGEVERVLAAMARPHDASAVRAALATEMAGWSAFEIARLEDDETRWSAEVRRLEYLGHLWRRQGVLRALGQYMNDNGVAGRLLAYADGERRMTNVRHLTELLHRSEEGGRRSPEDLLRWVVARERRRIAGTKEAELRLESDSDAVQIATVHAAKGLEYGVVFATSLWDGKDPDWEGRWTPASPPFVHEGADVVLDLGSDQLEERRRTAEAEQLAEDVRLAYVALTRAKHRAYVVWGPCSGGEYASLGYLLHGHTAAGDTPALHVAAARSQTKDALLGASSALHAIAELHPTLMGVEALPWQGAFVPLPLGAEGELDGVLEARLLGPEARARLAPRTIASFSAWTRGAHAETPGMDEGSTAVVDEAPPELPQGMHAFAGGLQAGVCLHAVLEEADFTEPTAEKTRVHVERTLRAHGFMDPLRHRAPIDPAQSVMDLLGHLATAPLPGVTFTLGEIPRGKRLDEWRFTLKLGLVAPATLADVFARHAAPELQPYAERLRHLSRDAVEGLLTGTADLVFEHEGQYGLVDWKSNRLGETAAAYTPERVRDTMMDSHYVLQYHLYLVGLDAYLKTRLADYDYDRHVLGAWYAFLRGVEPGHAGGLYYDRPSRALIEALGAAIRPAG